jgi:molecular chaperone DnaK
VDYGEKVPAADKSAIESAIAALRTALEGDDGETIKAKTSELVQASMKLGEAMYKTHGAEGAAPETAEKDDVIDAEFKEVGPDDHKKSA